MIERIAELFEGYAPLSGADAAWDNVGVLIAGRNSCRKVLVTVDMTMAVVEECVRKGVQNVISYHPVIFHPLRRIAEDECVVAECLRHDIAVFSPHTALDRKMNAHLLGLVTGGGEAEGGLGAYVAAGANARSIGEIVATLKALTGLEHLRLSLGRGHGLQSVPGRVHVGVGASFRKVECADVLLVTGEMRHHDLLHNAARNVSAILLEHGNSERIFFRERKADFDGLFPDFEVLLSEADRDPVAIF